MSHHTAKVQLAQLKQYLQQKVLPSNKHYTCGTCGTNLTHDEVRQHWPKCPNKPVRGWR